MFLFRGTLLALGTVTAERFYPDKWYLLWGYLEPPYPEALNPKP